VLLVIGGGACAWAFYRLRASTATTRGDEPRSRS